MLLKPLPSGRSSTPRPPREVPQEGRGPAPDNPPQRRGQGQRLEPKWLNSVCLCLSLLLSSSSSSMCYARPRGGAPGRTPSTTSPIGRLEKTRDVSKGLRGASSSSSSSPLPPGLRKCALPDLYTGPTPLLILGKSFKFDESR